MVGPTRMLEKHSQEKGPFASMTCTQGSAYRCLANCLLALWIQRPRAPLVVVDTYMLLGLSAGRPGKFPHRFNRQPLMCKAWTASPSLFI